MGGVAQRTCMQYVASMRSSWLHVAVIRVNGGLTRSDEYFGVIV